MFGEIFEHGGADIRIADDVILAFAGAHFQDVQSFARVQSLTFRRMGSAAAYGLLHRLLRWRECRGRKFKDR